MSDSASPAGRSLTCSPMSEAAGGGGPGPPSRCGFRLLQSAGRSEVLIFHGRGSLPIGQRLTRAVEQCYEVIHQLYQLRIWNCSGKFQAPRGQTETSSTGLARSRETLA